MAGFILILGYLVVGLCLAMLLAPRIARKMIDFYSIGSRLYLAGLIRLVLGIILLLLAKESRLWGYVVVMGLLSAGSGLFLFFLALKRTKKLLFRLRKQSDAVLRLYVFLALAIWLLLIYAVFPFS